MYIALSIEQPSSLDVSASSYDSGEDDVRSILIDICEILEPTTDFLISGFGQNRWPVDVRTDLPVFLEQLPLALRAVSEGSSTDIDFYEQGIERSIALTPAGDRYLATCSSWTNWQPNPAVETIDRWELEEMLLSVREVFMRALGETSTQLSRHPWILQWLRGSPEAG